jgi:hypothetical protein
MRELIGSFVATLQSGQLERLEIRRQRVLDILLSTGSRDGQRPLTLLVSAMATGMAHDVQTDDGLLVIIKDAILATARSLTPVPLADLPFILWSAAAHFPSLSSITDARAVIGNVVTLLVSSSFSHLPQGSQLAAELLSLVKMGSLTAQQIAAVKVLVTELLGRDQHPIMIWKSWGFLFENLRTQVSLSETLALISFLLLPQIFSSDECHLLGWHQVAALLSQE